MFNYRTRLHLKNTDATGVLYFSEQFSFAMEAFEGFLLHKGFSLKELLNSPILMPVVHAEADFMAPLRVGDEVEIKMEVEAIGTTSISLAYQLVCPVRNREVGKVKIVHVCVDRKTQAKVSVPTFLRELLHA